MSITSLKRHSLFRNGLALGAVAVFGAGLLPAAPAIAAPPRADLVVAASVDPTEVVETGGWSTLTVDVRNAGARASQDLTLAFELPAGAWFFSEGFVIPPSWQCDLLGTATCTHAPLAGGEVAEPLSVPVGLPTGTAGDAVTFTATASAGRESSLSNNTGRATVRYVPGTVDLFFTGGTSSQELIDGEQAYVSTNVRNAGTRASGDVTVTMPVPAGLTNSSVSGGGWDCAYGDTLAAGQPGWRCTRAPLAAGETSDWLNVSATVSGATPGDVLALDLTVSTTSAETNLDNNTERHSITVLQSATVRGTVWVDSDRDGVRDAAEPGAPVGSGGIDHIVLIPQTSGQPGVLATVNPDGTYLAHVRPGTYRTEFYVQDPHTFIDSADSDLVYYDNNTGGYNNYGYTGWFTVAGGDDVTLDAGVL
jgi:Domain of unknown function DUF11